MALAPADIFKAYDIRGLYGEQIDGDDGRADRPRVRARALGDSRASRVPSCASGSGATCA